MPLRGDQIRCVGGEIYAHIFENERRNVPRQLFWNVILRCTPVRWDGRDWDCSVHCDWLAWDIARWPDLDGANLKSAKRPESVEGSFYFADYHLLAVKSLELRRIDKSCRFDISVAGSFDLRGFGDLDASDVGLAANCDVGFSGLIVVPENLGGNPTTPGLASAVASEFIELADFGPPRWDRFRFVFEPKERAAKGSHRRMSLKTVP